MIERNFFTTYTLEAVFGILFILFINVVLIYLIRHKSFEQRSRKFLMVLIGFNIISISAFIYVWQNLKPPQVEYRVAFRPTEITDDMPAEYRFLFVEQIEHNLLNQDQDQITFHSVWWTYAAMRPQYEVNIALYDTLYRRIGADDIVSSNLREVDGVYTFTMRTETWQESVNFKDLEQFAGQSGRMIDAILGHYHLKRNRPQRSYVSLPYITMKQFYHRNEVDSLVNHGQTFPVSDSTLLANTVIARGYTRIASRTFKYLDIENPYIDDNYKRPFIEAQKRLFYFYNKDPQNADLYPALIEYFLFSEQYDEADNLIKAYLTDFGKRNRIRRTDPETMLNYSYLHPSRLREDGYRSQEDIIRDVLQINPLSDDGWNRFASIILDNYQLTSPPTERMLKALEAYYQLNPYSPTSLRVLAESLLDRGDIINARRYLYQLKEIEPESSYVYHDLGIVYYRMGINFDPYQEFVGDVLENGAAAMDTAKWYFRKAIAIDRHLEAHLYLANIFAKTNQPDSAIKYFRYRVKNRLGPEDRYYKEAKKGLRRIFEDSVILRRYLEKEGMLRDGF